MSELTPAIVSAIVAERGDGKQYAICVRIGQVEMGTYSCMCDLAYYFFRDELTAHDMVDVDVAADPRCISQYCESGDRLTYAHVRLD